MGWVHRPVYSERAEWLVGAEWHMYAEKRVSLGIMYEAGSKGIFCIVFP